MEARLRLTALLGGFTVTQMLYVVARLNLADHIAAGPMTIEQLAGECGAKADPLRRIVRALAAFGVFEFQDDGLVANTPLSACLRTGAPHSLRDAALVYGEEHYHAMSELLQAVKRGGTAFEHAYRKPHFTYLASNPDAAHTYYDATRAATAKSADAVVEAYDFTHAATVVDVGGGDGQLIRAVLRANPGVAGILVESAGLARKARARIHAAGLDERCEVQTGDVFEAVPRGGDIYLLAHVVHALDDHRALCVLRSIRRSMGSDARLLVIERLVPDQPEANLSAQQTFVSDAVAMAISGGRERTLAEHAALLAGAELRVVHVRETSWTGAIIEAAARH